MVAPPSMWMRARILHDIDQERERQGGLKVAGKFRYTLADNEISDAERLTVVAEEFGEVAHEVNETIGDHAKLDRAKLRAELVQLAAVCVAWIENLDNRP